MDLLKTLRPALLAFLLPAALPGAADTSPDAGSTVFYASMEDNDEWRASQTPDFKRAVYSFTLDGASFTPCTEINSSSKPNPYYAGIYLDGTYYNVSVPEGTFLNYTSSFKTIATDTWTVTEAGSYKKGNMLPFDMTYDYTTSTAYAVSPKGGYGSTRGGTYLHVVDLATGNFTQVGETEYMVFALACDGNGQLWGIGTPNDLTIPTYLFKIDKTTGAATTVGEVGTNLYTASHTTATFDLRTGKLYWAAKTYEEDSDYQRTYTTALFEVNTSTGKATVARLFANNELMAGLFMKDCHPKAPGAAKNLRFDFLSGSTTEGKVAFTLPSLSYDGTTLQGTLKVEISVDGDVRTIEGLAPGSEYEDETATPLASGTEHTVSVTCYAGDLKGLPATTGVHAGNDAPEAVSGLTVTANPRGDEAQISWNAPDKGANGGHIDAASLTYDVVLKPDNVTVAEGLTDTKYTYKFSRKMGISQFQVTPHAGGLTGATASSDVQLLGTPWNVPYLETFDYAAEAYWPFTVIDTNHDGSDEVGLKWFFDPNNYCALYYADPNGGHGDADDWLITPTIRLSTDSVYRVQFDTRGYMGGTNHIVLTVGEEATAASQDRVLMDETYDTTEGQRTYATLFRPAEGDLRFGFHNVSDGSDHTYIDNIYVARYGSTAIPAAPEVEAAKSGSTVVLRGTAPAATVGGEAADALTELKIYRNSADGTPVFTVSPIAAGEKFDWIDATPGLGECKYVVVASNAEGDGMEAYATVNTRADVPQPVTHVKVTGKNGWTEAAISWEYPADGLGVNGLPIADGEITYNVSRTIGVKTEVIAENLAECSYTDTKVSEAFANGAQQSYVTYTVTPKTTGGSGESTKSEEVLMGKAFGLPFAESWTDQGEDNAPWMSANATRFSSWSVASTGYDPSTGGTGQDGSGLATFSIGSSMVSQGNADYVSPRIDVASYRDVQVSFYLYRSTDEKTSGSYLQVGFDTEENGTMILPEEYNVYGETDGWEQHTVALPADLAGSSRLSLVFRGYSNNTKGRVHIDHVTVSGVQPEFEVSAVAITGPENCLIGNDNIYKVQVANNGSAANEGVSVSLYADDERVSTQSVGQLASGATKEISFTYAPSIAYSERLLTLRAEVTANADGSEANNSVATTVWLVAPMLPYVTDLAATSGNGAAYLTWGEATTYPHEETLSDGAESYEAFAISDAGEWQFIDEDGGPTMPGISVGNSILTWPNAGEKQAFIVFNPSQAGDGSFDMTQLIAPRTGQQCFICFAARGGNDDWMVSPQLSGRAQTISFYAKAAYPYETEQFEVWASSTSSDLSAFSCVSGGTPVGVSSYTDWARYEYPLPEGTRFFAIRCVSDEQTGLMIDDVTYSPAYSSLQFWGYNVYRDGEKITPDPVGDNAYTDSGMAEGEEHSYNVTSVYKEGESIFSNRVSVTIQGKAAGLAGVNADAAHIRIAPVQGGVQIDGAAGATLCVYAADGRLLYQTTGTGADRLPLASGTYVVRAGQTTAKVSVK